MKNGESFVSMQCIRGMHVSVIRGAHDLQFMQGSACKLKFHDICIKHITINFEIINACMCVYVYVPAVHNQLIK